MDHMGNVRWLSWLLLTSSCSGSSAIVAPDAPLAAGPDAPLALADAGPTPDGPLVRPDGPVGVMDARPSSADTPLAIVDGRPQVDAAPIAADAAPPDAPPPLSGGKDIPLGAKPYALAQNVATQRLYVALTIPASQGFGGAGVAVIDETTNTLVTTIPPPKANSLVQALQGLAVDEAANRIYAVSNTAQSLWVIDGSTNAFMTPIPLPAPA